MNNNLKKTGFLSLLTIVLFSFSSCERERTEAFNKVQDESEHAHEINEVAFIFRQGHLHGKRFHAHELPENHQSNPLSVLIERKISLKKHSDGSWHWDADQPVRIALGHGLSYSLEVELRNKKGAIINDEFLSEQERKVHQIFFNAENVTPLKEGQTLTTRQLLEYHYADTYPFVSKNALTDPVGFKGYFKFLTPYYAYDLRVRLYHILGASKYKSDGSPYPFDQPGRWVNEFNQKIPIKVFTQHPEHEDDLSAMERYYQEVATEFGISLEQTKNYLSAFEESEHHH